MFNRKKKRSREFKNSSQVINLEDAREQRKKKRAEAAEKKNKGRKPKGVITERRASKKVRRRLIYVAILLVIISIIGVSAFNIVSLKLNEAKLMDEQAGLLLQKEKLEKELEQIGSPEYIENQARQQLRMIKPGELLFVLPGKDKPATTGPGIIPE